MRVCILHRFPKEEIEQTNASFPYLLRDGVDVKTFKSFNRFNPKLKLLKSIWWVFTAWTRTVFRNYDVIYCDDSFPWYPILVKLTSPKSKVVLRLGDLHLMYYCDGFAYKILHWFELIGWRLADRILAISQTMQLHIASQLSDIKIYNVPDPVDPKFFNHPRIKLGERPIVMFHGTLTKNKGLNRLMRCAMRMPEIDFVIIGEGEELQQLKDQGLSNVEFKGWVSYETITNHLTCADIGIAMRSWNRGNDYVVTSPWLQYNALGIPCIATRRKVFTDMNYLWQFDSTEELVKLIKQILENPPTPYWRDYVHKNHDARKIGEEIWSHLLSSVNQSPKN